MALIDKLTAIADAIRVKTGKSSTMTLSEMPAEIEGLIYDSDADAELRAQADAIIDGSITSFSSDITSIGHQALSFCTNLTSISLPSATRIGNHAFYDCNKLTSISLPSATSIGHQALSFCTNLTSISLPSATSIDTMAFFGSEKLTSISLPSATSLCSEVFDWCYSLTRLVLCSETVCKFTEKYGTGISLFEKAYHFLGTVDSTYNPKGLKDGYIYVPSALVEDYKVATNWSTYADRFRALEDFTVDGSITGELDDEKIAAADAAEGSD